MPLKYGEMLIGDRKFLVEKVFSKLRSIVGVSVIKNIR